MKPLLAAADDLYLAMRSEGSAFFVAVVKCGCCTPISHL